MTDKERSADLPLNTILFDLDGTLLSMSMERFLGTYIPHLCRATLPEHDMKRVSAALFASTELVMSDLSGRTREQVFASDFYGRVGLDHREYSSVFDNYYGNRFDELAEQFPPEPLVKLAVDELLRKGYTLVIASNSLFPLSAMKARIRWAGLEPDDFVLITGYEEMHACKPNLEYFREILEKIGKNPGECMMVGNDAEEDMVAGRLGIKTFFLDVNAIIRGESPQVDYRGDYAALLTLVKELPEVR